jgi:branched-chain amino acid transport system permease protein
MSELLQHISNGLIAGSAYGLLALSMTMIYGILTVPDFGMGAVYTLGAFISFYIITWFDPDYYLLSLVPVFLAAGLIGILSERLVFRPLECAPHAAGFIGALGLYSIMEGGWNVWFGPDWRNIISPYNEMVITLGSTSFTLQRIIILALCLLFALGTYLFIYRTITGKKIRACSENRDVARLLGVNTRLMTSLTFFVSYALAAIGGALVAPTALVGASMGMTPIIKAFIVVALGGLGSVPGAIVGGLILGIGENLGAAYISSQYKDLFAFGIFLAVLLLRPQGLFRR